jgi:hypothetical protein
MLPTDSISEYKFHLADTDGRPTCVIYSDIDHEPEFFQSPIQSQVTSIIYCTRDAKKITPPCNSVISDAHGPVRRGEHFMLQFKVTPEKMIHIRGVPTEEMLAVFRGTLGL